MRLPNCQLGETEGREVYPGVRLHSLSSNYSQHAKRCQVKITTLSKISDKSNEMCDILKPALAIAVGSAAVRETSTLAEPPIMHNYGCRKTL